MKLLRKDESDDDIKSHKKSEFHPLSRRHIFGKTAGGVKLTSPAFSGLKASRQVGWPGNI